MPQSNAEILMEGRTLMYRNFSGAPTRFKEEGHRSFAVVLDKEEAEAMAADGWAIRYLRPRDEYEEALPIISVKVQYKTRGMPPQCYLVTEAGKALLAEDQLIALDWVKIKNADLVIRAYNWTNARGESGTSAYLKKIYVTMEEDALERKYRDVPDSALGAITAGENFEETPAIHMASETLAITRGEGVPF